MHRGIKNVFIPLLSGAPFSLGIYCNFILIDKSLFVNDFFATDIFEKNNYNLVLVQQLLQHSSPTITQKYIGITSEQMEQALKGHIALV